MKTTKWNLDPTHSELGFKIKHLMIANVSGSFRNFDAQVETTGDDFTSARIKASASIQSISTNNEQRDNHLRTSDFFSADQYPELHFQSTKIEKVEEDTYSVYGDLTMKGVTNPVKLTVERSLLKKDPWGNERAGFVISGKINRSDWGINFNNLMETGGFALGEEVRINSEIQVVKEVAEVSIEQRA